jgi:hypothetical protein
VEKCIRPVNPANEQAISDWPTDEDEKQRQESEPSEGETVVLKDFVFVSLAFSSSLAHNLPRPMNELITRAARVSYNMKQHRHRGVE